MASNPLCESPLDQRTPSIDYDHMPLGTRMTGGQPGREGSIYAGQSLRALEKLYEEDLKRGGEQDTDGSVLTAEKESSEEQGTGRVPPSSKSLPECSLGTKLIKLAGDVDDRWNDIVEMETPWEDTDLQDRFSTMVMDDSSPPTSATERERVHADVRPCLKRIATFRDLLNEKKFKQAEEFLEQFVKDDNARKYRRNVLASFDRCFQRYIMSKNVSEDSETLLGLHAKLLDVLKREEMKVESIEEAFQEKNWVAMNALFTAKKKSLSKKQLHQVILLAAEKNEWKVVSECVALGADLVRSEGKLVYTNTVKDYLLSPPSSDSDDDDDGGDTATLKKGKKPKENLDQRSPLHEALKTGQFQLAKVADCFQKNADFCNITDKAGDPLLHLAVQHGTPQIRKDNVQLLLQYQADVNTLDSRGRTAMQYLQHRLPKPWEVDLLLMLVTQAGSIHPKTWRAGAEDWTPLHMVCNNGRYEDLTTLINKGDNPQALRRGLTLIDTVILQESVHCVTKQKILDALLKDPIKLGPFHAQTIQRRAAGNERKYSCLLLCGKDYLYPTDRLLFPLISTYTVREVYKEMVVTLLEGDAVCQMERAHLRRSLDSLKEDDPGFLRRVGELLDKKDGSLAGKKDGSLVGKKDGSLVGKKDGSLADKVAQSEQA